MAIRYGSADLLDEPRLSPSGLAKLFLFGTESDIFAPASKEPALNQHSLMPSENQPIRVLVCANTADELADLESVIRESDSLQLAGSSFERDRLDELIESFRPDVLLQQGSLDDDSEDIFVPDSPVASPVRVLLVSDSELSDALAAMRSSDIPVRALLPRSSFDSEICAAIEAVAEGLLVLHPDFAARSLAVYEPRGRDADPAAQTLSPRESEILNLLAAGLGNKQIAAQLNISEHTVKFHVTSIFNKLNASSRAEAVAIGARRGLILL
jgi:NarL family two-component system response regulator YdfI